MPGTEGICRDKAGNHVVTRTEAQSGLESVFAAIDPGITVSQACKTQSAKIAGGREGRECQPFRSEEHTSELQSLMRISYAVFCLKKKKKYNTNRYRTNQTII